MPATGATFWNVAPIMETLVFALEDACASTSAKRPDWSAVMLNAVSASVTMSETCPKSSPDAAARFIMPGKPPNIWSVFQPAIAIYSSAFPASTAVNCVVAPMCLAISVRRVMSSVVAFEIAFTVDICASSSRDFLTGPA